MIKLIKILQLILKLLIFSSKSIIINKINNTKNNNKIKYKILIFIIKNHIKILTKSILKTNFLYSTLKSI